MGAAACPRAPRENSAYLALATDATSQWILSDPMAATATVAHVTAEWWLKTPPTPPPTSGGKPGGKWKEITRREGTKAGSPESYRWP